jgi:glycosyltransferase involved in cell wall biosynthesis
LSGLVFVGPDPDSRNITHAGGQLTAARGFASFAAERDIALRWVDTAQSNFPVPPLRERLRRAIARVGRFSLLIGAPDNSGAILFSGAGVSFIERSLMAALARLRGKPSVLMIRSGHFRTLYERSAPFRLAARVLLRIPTRVGVQGRSWIPVLERAGVPAAKIAVIPNWISCPPAAPSVRKARTGQPLRLLFAGWVTEAKGIPELLEAARLVAAAGLPAQLTIAGGGTLLEAARDATREEALEGRLIVTDWLDREAMAQQFAEADILILPSHAEGFPNVVMEALAEGMPVIATPVGAIPDSITSGVNGTIVPVRQAAALAEAIRGYLDDPPRLERQSRAAIESAARLHNRDANCAALVAALASRDDFVPHGR